MTRIDPRTKKPIPPVAEPVEPEEAEATDQEGGDPNDLDEDVWSEEAEGVKREVEKLTPDQRGETFALLLSTWCGTCGEELDDEGECPEGCESFEDDDDEEDDEDGAEH